MKRTDDIKVVSGGSAFDIYGAYRREQSAQQDARHEARMKAERDLLGDATGDEFELRREAQRCLIVEPDLPLEEMSMDDFCKARERDQARMRPARLNVGEMSYQEYIKERGPESTERTRDAQGRFVADGTH